MGASAPPHLALKRDSIGGQAVSRAYGGGWSDECHDRQHPALSHARVALANALFDSVARCACRRRRCSRGGGRELGLLEKTGKSFPRALSRTFRAVCHSLRVRVGVDRADDGFLGAAFTRNGHCCSDRRDLPRYRASRHPLSLTLNQRRCSPPARNLKRQNCSLSRCMKNRGRCMATESRFFCMR